ncbi:MAG TPA: rhomboid family intramembrane serine protease [Pyrinomonadaceae bacterium]|jgi:membrane associated rhomboid family serine protease|nr:rhomboid family intramembrane serine protease [Pyrinomonadaceae bacterium]
MSLKVIDPEENSQPQGPDQVPDDDGRTVVAQHAFPYFTIVIIAALAAVYLFQNTTGFENSFDVADANNRLIRNGQYWRLVTGNTMHGFFWHIALNCMALYSLGSAIELLSNRAHLAIVFLFAAVGGSVMSALLLPEINSVGASGGILGLAGYLTVYGYKRRRLLPPGFLKNMLINLAIVAGMGVIGYLYIDNAAHLGGFLVGAIYGLIQIPKDLYEDPRKVDVVTAVMGYATLAAFISFATLTILLLTKKIAL